ncbi:hypothetical protein CBER1_04379 [Cercospora berteroae]|uniref:Anaphase-promoting complex subunit 5 n=1 Tax=Cercospora berteroae TaxID=357750 RepID=A0A2S6CCH9_9PEZI|nr:hypothetical protein CBER1_04379 [Cercospora berteroae]
MPRYLTPSRIGLLVLIRLYKSGRNFGAKDTINILEFIAKHTVYTADHNAQLVDEKKDFFSSDISVFQSQLKQWQSASLPGQPAWNIFVAAIWNYLDGLDSLGHLITELRQGSVPTTNAVTDVSYQDPVTPASPLGQFIRRCYVEFTRLQFGDVQALWKSFEAWRAPSWGDFARFWPDHAQQLDDLRFANNEETNAGFAARLSHSDTSPSASAAIDADLLLTYAIRQLQQFGTRVPDDVKAKLTTWVDELSATSASTQSMHFFMAFFEHSKAGQYTMALESLHRYFDYSLVARSSSGAGDNVNLRVYYQYALLHLSVLHAEFECWDESVDAMNECIATARENQDSACLNFALSWLLYLRHAHPGNGVGAYASIAGVVGGGESDEIAFLKTKARDSKNWLLLSSTLLEEGRLELSNGGNANRAQEYALQALYLSVQHDLRSLAPAASLFYGSCLDRLGQSHLGNRQYELGNTVHEPHCPVNDRVRSTCRSALLKAHQGHYSEALEQLNSISSTVRGILKAETRLTTFSALIHLRRSIHRGTHEPSSYYLNQLRPLLSSADPELCNEFYTLEIEHHVSRKDYPTAMDKVASHLASSRSTSASDKQHDNSDLAHRLHYLIQKARVFALAGRASKGSSLCLRATATAERHLLVPVMLEGLCVLGRILIEVGEFAAARRLYEASLPLALEGGDAALVARMWTALGESCVGLAGRCQEGRTASDGMAMIEERLERLHDGDISEAEPSVSAATAIKNEQKRLMRRAEECIERGREVFEGLQAVDSQMECLVMKMRLAEWSGDETARTLAEKMFDSLARMETE